MNYSILYHIMSYYSILYCAIVTFGRCEGEGVVDQLRRVDERHHLALVHDAVGRELGLARLGHLAEELLVLGEDPVGVLLEPRALVLAQVGLARAVPRAVHHHVDAGLGRRDGDHVGVLLRVALQAGAWGEDALRGDRRGDDVAVRALREELDLAVVGEGALAQQLSVARAQELAALVVLRHADPARGIASGHIHII